MKKYVIKLVLLPLMLCTTAACALDSDFFAAPPDDRPFYKRPKTYPRAREASEKLPVYSSIFTKIQVAFAPWNDVEGLIVKTINKAREEILVQAYVLSNQQLIAALLQAHERGVKVKVLVDRKQMQARDSRVLDLVSAGIPVGLEVRYHSAHNKLIILDPESSFDATVITGSMNYSDTSPSRNAENVLVIEGASELAKDYAKNWHRHAKAAVPYGSGRRLGR